MRVRAAWAFVVATSSCAIVANLGDRTLGDVFPDDGGADATIDGVAPSGDGDTIGDGGGDGIAPPFDAPPGCIVENVPAPLVDTQIYLAVDTSASMTMNLPEGGTRFTNERQAVEAFVKEPLSGPLNVTMGTHPATTIIGDCDAGPYTTPPVPLGVLGGGTADAIVNALNAVPQPNGQSPWSAMLTGAHQKLAALDKQTPGRVTALVFMADSTPTACEQTEAGVISIVKGPAQGNPPIRTYMIGITDLPADVTDWFNPIAQAGGTGAGYATVPPSANTMLAALEAIRDDVACNVAVPLIGGKPADLANGVLFVRTPAGDTTAARVANATACGATDAYYPEATPDRVHLCPKTCARVLGDATAKTYAAACKP
jgi:hypothetical protein